MTLNWEPISEDISKASIDHQIIVVGSGYGGGVAASRLSRAGQQVTLLERGLEIAPGDYPNNMNDGLNQFQYRLSHRGTRLGNPRGLYDLRIGDNMNVFVGCGLGGTSLINANVALEPDPRVYAKWPEPFKSNPDELKDHFQAARDMLGTKTLPADQKPPKLAALEMVAKGLKTTAKRAPINVMFEDGPNAAGIYQKACNNCGDCVSGCNVGAKNTVLMNYLPDAAGRGAQIYTGAEVTHLERDGDRWLVHVAELDAPLKAKIVILAAGTLGSTEILLRSRSKALPFSRKLGQKFSGNGDIWAFGYNANMTEGDPGKIALRPPVYGVGAGTHDPSEGERYAPGPCITGMIYLQGEELEQDVLIEEGVMPGALAPAYAGGFPMMDALLGDVFRFGDAPERLNDAKELGEIIEKDPVQFAETAYIGPVSRTMPFLVMSHDASDGELTLEADNVVVKWEDAGLDPAIVHDAHVIRRASDAIQAEYLPNPLWQDAFNNRLVTVHPIGGCAMGADGDAGVVNADCQVFASKDKLHPDLFVCDGAAIPGGVGVNPHLTITAVAERAMARLVAAKEWSISDTIPPPQVAPPPDAGAAGPDWNKTLLTLLGDLQDIQDQFDKDKLWCARRAIAQFWLKITVGYRMAVPKDMRKSHPIASVPQVMLMLRKDEDLLAIAKPLVEQALLFLKPGIPAIVDRDIRKVIDVMEMFLGDFSPAGGFVETMTGQLSTVGLHDSHPPTDPYLVAAQGGEDCTLVADIHTNAIHSAITPPDGALDIRSGTLTSKALGGRYAIENGKFQYLLPNPSAVEMWEMRYWGDLSPLDGQKDKLRFYGFKTIQRREGSHWWKDLTELRVDVFKNNSDEFTRQNAVARGMLLLKMEDLVKQAHDLQFGYPDGALETGFRDFYAAMSPANAHDLPTRFADPVVRANMVKGICYALDSTQELKLQSILEGAYKLKTFGRMGMLVLRTYGDIFSYGMNFQNIDRDKPLERDGFIPPEIHHFTSEPGVTLQLSRFKGSKGPIVMAGGFGTRAMSYALPTVDENLVQMLIAQDYDVWLFDYRGSGAIKASQTPFTLDQVAQHDWPAAIAKVLEISGAKDVQVLAHCIGSMTLFMAMLYRKLPIRSVISSATGPHAISNWFNFAKSDANMAKAFASGLPRKTWGLLDLFQLDPEVKEVAKNGLPVFDPCAPSAEWSDALNVAIDGLAWKVPDFAPTGCYSPTCHRIWLSFGPSYNHDQLNQATHNTIADLFGPVASQSFVQLSEIFGKGHAISATGDDIYMGGVKNLDMPIHFIVGAKNQEMLPEATLRTLHWLHDHFPNDKDRYTRHVYQDYGHMDTFIGKRANIDIFPDLLKILDQTA